MNQVIMLKTISRHYTYICIATIVIKLRYLSSKGRLMYLRYKYSRSIPTYPREALINILISTNKKY